MKLYVSIMTNAVCLLEIEANEIDHIDVLNKLEGNEKLCKQIADELYKSINIDNLTVEAIQQQWKLEEGETVISVGEL